MQFPPKANYGEASTSILIELRSFRGENAAQRAVQLSSTRIGNGIVTLGINVLPEPSTIVIWSGLGVCGLIFAWRRRRQFQR